MCGGCGVDRRDWAAGLVGGSYARTVVARLLQDASGLQVSAGPAGWTLASRGRPGHLHPTFDELMDAVGAAAGDAAGALAERVSAARPHRELTMDRNAVPLSHRAPASADADASSDPTRAIHRILVAALSVRAVPSAPADVTLADAGGPWRLVIPRAHAILAVG